MSEYYIVIQTAEVPFMQKKYYTISRMKKHLGKKLGIDFKECGDTLNEVHEFLMSALFDIEYLCTEERERKAFKLWKRKQ